MYHTFEDRAKKVPDFRGGTYDSSLRYIEFKLINGGIIRYLRYSPFDETQGEVIIHYIFLPEEQRHRGLFVTLCALVRYLQGDSKVNKIIFCGVSNETLLEGPSSLTKAGIKYEDHGGDFVISKF